MNTAQEAGGSRLASIATLEEGRTRNATSIKTRSTRHRPPAGIFLLALAALWLPAMAEAAAAGPPLNLNGALTQLTAEDWVPPHKPMAKGGPHLPGSTAAIVTESGPLKGIETSTEDQFLGIPYAAPPVGSLRWLPPEPHGHWQGVLHATQFGNYCT
jgi:hypothetical protein